MDSRRLLKQAGFRPQAVASAEVAKGLRHHFTLLPYYSEYTEADINSDILQSKTHPRDNWLAESESFTEHKQYQLGATQHLVRALHSDNGSNRHVSITNCADCCLSCLEQVGIQLSPSLSENPVLNIGLTL